MRLDVKCIVEVKLKLAVPAADLYLVGGRSLNLNFSNSY